MHWSCIPSKNLTTEPLPVVPVVSSYAVAVEPLVVKKSCCAPVSCVPLRCFPSCKKEQPLVLRSTPPAETEKRTDVAEVSAPDAVPVQVSATGPVAPVSQ